MATKKKTIRKAAEKRITGWHFLEESMDLGYSDGRRAVVGKTLSIPADQTPEACSVGMHASLRPSQAASFKKGPVITKVEVWGDVDSSESDKVCGRSRKVLWAHRMTRSAVEDLAKSCGFSKSNLAGNEISSNLQDIASHDPDKFDAWFEKLAAGQITLTPSKPPLDEDALLGQLMPRTIRTKREILKGFGSFYDLTPVDEWSDDRFDELVEVLSGDKVFEIEGFTATGASGYVLKARSR